MKTTFVTALAAALGCSGCLAESALDYDELHVSATRPDNTTASTSPQNGCVILPILLGSHIERSVHIDGTIDVAVDATRDRAKVTIRGVSFPESRTILAEDLRAGSFSLDVPVDGFVVHLRGSCPNTPDSG